MTALEFAGTPVDGRFPVTASGEVVATIVRGDPQRSWFQAYAPDGGLLVARDPDARFARDAADSPVVELRGRLFRPTRVLFAATGVEGVLTRQRLASWKLTGGDGRTLALGSRRGGRIPNRADVWSTSSADVVGLPELIGLVEIIAGSMQSQADALGTGGT